MQTTQTGDTAMTNMKAVAETHEAILAANAAEPYDHSAYTSAVNAAKEAATAYYGEALVETYEYVWHDCQEVWPRERLLTLAVERQRVDLRWAMEMLALISDNESEMQNYHGMAQRAVIKMRSLDPELNMEAEVAEAAAHALRNKLEMYALEVEL